MPSKDARQKRVNKKLIELIEKKYPDVPFTRATRRLAEEVEERIIFGKKKKKNEIF